MNKNTLVSRTQNFGDFNVQYTRITREGRKVRASDMGTSDFDNKYILEQVRKLHRPLNPTKLKALAAKALDKGDFMFWSWTANRLVTVSAKTVSRVTSMSAELANGRQL